MNCIIDCIWPADTFDTFGWVELRTLKGTKEAPFNHILYFLIVNPGQHPSLLLYMWTRCPWEEIPVCTFQFPGVWTLACLLFYIPTGYVLIFNQLKLIFNQQNVVDLERFVAVDSGVIWTVATIPNCSSLPGPNKCLFLKNAFISVFC